MPFPDRLRRLLLCLLLLVAAPGNAHVGAPDVYVKAAAGPYPLLVSVHPPAVLPGTAAVDVRTAESTVNGVEIALPGSGWQGLTAFRNEQLFTGGVWIARDAAWTLRIRVHGGAGDAETAVPVPAMPQAAPQRFLFSPLFWLLSLAILAGLAFAVRLPHRRLAGGATVLVAAYFVLLLMWSAKNDNAAPAMDLKLEPGGMLAIAVPRTGPGLVADHGHLMHLFAVREPGMDVLLHLHPEALGGGRFETQLPSMAGGAFRLYADIVHTDGRLETFTAEAGLPAQTGHALAGDDSIGIVPPLGRSAPAGSGTGNGTTSVRLPDGYMMTLTLASPLRSKTGQLLHFALLDPAEKPPADMQLYMGMAAHAAVFKTDGAVFAHIHPAGTIPMPAYSAATNGMDMSAAPASEVSLPFGFPGPGTYRIFVEMKHGGIIETGAFDLAVAP